MATRRGRRQGANREKDWSMVLSFFSFFYFTFKTILINIVLNFDFVASGEGIRRFVNAVIFDF